MTSIEWQGTQELADELGVPVRTVYAWRTQGKGPRAHRIGKHLRYRRRDVEAWLSGQAEERPGGPAPAATSASTTTRGSAA